MVKKLKTIYFIGVKNNPSSHYLRGKQIVDKLKNKYNLNIITTPDNLIPNKKNLNPNKIHNSIIVLIKKSKIKSGKELKIINILKKNNNIIIHDLIDSNYNDILKDRNYYDAYICCNNFYKEMLKKHLNKEVYNIPHHLDFRFNNIKKKNIQEVKLVYLGAVNYRHETNCYFIKELKKDYNLDLIGGQFGNSDQIKKLISRVSNYNVHVDIRNKKTINYKMKPGTKTTVAAAFNSIIITTKHPGAYDLLGPDYPYYCECDYSSVKKTINFVKETFNKKEWHIASEILNNVKKKTHIDNIIKYYYDMFNKYS